ncbi:MAG: hypothetical protein LBJ61_02035 [Deltaproteobacteria bacterium]|jgi:hypothetical protein|nr:hypothetical protein [Deltaproteobacteria bacterium]
MRANDNKTEAIIPDGHPFGFFGDHGAALVLALSILAVLAILALTLSGQARAADPLDLADLGRAGLGEKSREIIVAQALAKRGRPPLEIGFVKELAAYGGDALAQAYLEMDAAVANQAESPLPPSSMKNMMAAGLSPSDLIKFSQSVNPETQKISEKVANQHRRVGGAAAVAAAAVTPTVAPAVAPAVPTTVAPTMDEGWAAPGTPIAEDGWAAPGTPIADEGWAEPKADAWAKPQGGEGNLNKAQANDGAIAGPKEPVKPKIAFAKPKDLRKIPQTLAPGQKADPARPLPEAPGPYWTRTPKGHGTFLGVTEEVKADGHRYEVNRNARGDRLGQEVLSRPSGHKVVRYYSQSPERALDGAEANDYGQGGEEFYGTETENDSANWYAD